MSMRRAAVLGSPIAHSLSPVLHRAAYEALGLEWTYEAVEMTEGGLTGFVDACGPEWAGLSLTMPLKVAVLPLLDHSSELVRLSAAANTLVFTPQGREGHNTDVPGMVAAIREAAGPTGLVCTSATVLGGGATGKSEIGRAHV